MKGGVNDSILCIMGVPGRGKGEGVGGGYTQCEVGGGEGTQFEYQFMSFDSVQARGREGAREGGCLGFKV
jgi:hypothetical protein